MFSKIFKSVSRHKFITSILIIAIAGGGYYGYKKMTTQAETVRYMTSAAEKGMLISSISGTGQVSASNTTDIKSKVSGDILEINVVNGQEVKTDTVIAKIDSADSQKAVRDAQNALETSQLELNKLLDPPTELELLQAQSAVDTAKRSLEDIINPSKDVISSAENSLTSAKDTLTKLEFSQADSYRNATDVKQKAEDNLVETYEDGFNTITSAFFDLPAIIVGMDNVLNGYDLSESELILSYQRNTNALSSTIESSDREDYDIEPFIASAADSYQTARKYYDKNYLYYRNVSRYSDHDTIENLLNDTVVATRAIAENLKNEANLYDFWVDYRNQRDYKIFAKVASYQTSIKSYTSTINSHLTSLLSAERAIEDSKDAIIDANRSLEELSQNQPIDLASSKRTVQEKKDVLDKLKNPEEYDIKDAKIAIQEKELALQELKDGADELDIRAKKITIQQKQEALNTAIEDLKDHEIYAPFDGIIAKVNVAKGDSVSSGTAIGSVITTQKIAEVTLNEIDAANTKVGQKVTLTFDAAEGVTAVGEVASIDTLGTVSQGVVSYQVKIAFDVQDERIKPGMSVSSSIIIDSKQNVIMSPISAVKTNGGSYVEILVNGAPQKKKVTTGISNDTMIEIVEGLEEWEQVITQTINPTAASAATPAQGGGSNVFRMMR
ncbi:MAG: efflux RND transporter periplasmic adaptor subunit [bacterium]